MLLAIVPLLGVAYALLIGPRFGTGNGDFNSCRLSPTSVISGSVNTVSLQMEEGASLEGQCKVGKARA